jgi:hypothetical protein
MVYESDGTTYIATAYVYEEDNMRIMDPATGRQVFPKLPTTDELLSNLREQQQADAAKPATREPADGQGEKPGGAEAEDVRGRIDLGNADNF